MRGRVLGVVLLGAVLAGAQARAEPGPAELRAALERVMPTVAAEHIAPTPVPGLYEVRFGHHVLYFSADGRHVLRGDLIDVETRSNLTEQVRRELRLAALERLGEEAMVVFAPAAPARHTITVFTDVDCPYCVRLHQEIPMLNAAGIKVRYAAFPRAGIDSASYAKMVSVWCAEDPPQAMNEAKLRRRVEPATCERGEQVKEQFGEGQALGVTGTPTIILDNGELLGGYYPYQHLIEMLDGQ